MKKGYIVLGVIGAIILLGVIYGVSTYNSLVSLKETVDADVSEIDNQLERRADLIPNLVNTVKGYMKHEEDVIASVTEARANLVGASNIKDKAEANEKLDQALNALLVIVENYPELKANENFLQLQAELTNTEEKIAHSRLSYNEAVNNYNTKIDVIPTNIIAGMFNFKKAELFEVENEEARKNVKISF